MTGTLQKAFGLGFLLTECIRRGGIQDLSFARQRACLRRHTCFWLVRKGTVSTPLSFMRKKAPLTVERKNSQGGFASEQTPHPSSCPPLAADRPRPFRCSSFSHTNRFAGFAWEPCPFAIPLKRPRKRRFLFLGTITPPNIGDGGIPYVKYSTGANGTTRTEYCALGKPNQTVRPKGVPCGTRFR